MPHGQAELVHATQIRLFSPAPPPLRPSAPLLPCIPAPLLPCVMLKQRRPSGDVSTRQRINNLPILRYEHCAAKGLCVKPHLFIHLPLIGNKRHPNPLHLLGCLRNGRRLCVLAIPKRYSTGNHTRQNNHRYKKQPIPNLHTAFSFPGKCV